MRERRSSATLMVLSIAKETRLKHSMKMMWVCVAVIGVVAIFAATGSGAG